MSKNWLLALPVLLCLLSCDGFSTGGNPNEVAYCRGSTQHHAKALNFYLTLNCSYGGICDASLFFLGGYYRDSLSGRCYSDYELKLVTKDTSKIVLSETENLVPIESDFHLRFSLFDINNIEKKYDIDLSGIINSYTVRGDSVDVNVMDNCRITVISTPQNIEVYGNVYPESNFIFSANESIRSWFGYDCIWHEQGSLKKDDLNIHAEIFWTK